MINEVRTYLLNSVRGSHTSDILGEEYVPSDFLVVTLPNVVQKLRSVIFGADPDRRMLNFRLRQLMPLLHVTELSEYVISSDSRITYWPIVSTEYFIGAFGTTVEKHAGTTGDLTPVGMPVSNEVSGRIYYWWRVDVTAADSVRVRKVNPPTHDQSYTYTKTEGLSNLISLTGSSLSFRFTGDVGSSWFVRTTVKPTRNLADILLLLDSTVSEDDEAELFGSPPSGDYAVFYNCWKLHPMLPYRLGGLLLAMAYRTKVAG